MKENHHYISQFYLKYFSPEGKKGLIWVYEKDIPYLLSIEKHVANIENYYMIDTPEGESNVIEKLFCEIEALTGRVFKKINEGNYDLSVNELETLLVFMSYLKARVPATRESINRPVSLQRKLTLRMIAQHEELFNQYFNDILIDNGEILTFSKFQHFVKNDIEKINLKMSQNEAIKTMYVIAKEIQQMFLQMNWSYLVAPKGTYFITSDCPVFPFMNNWRQSYKPGFGFKDVEVYFPLTPSVCMLGVYNNIKCTKTIDVDKVNVINSKIANNYYNYIYSNMDKEQFSKTIKHYNFKI